MFVLEVGTDYFWTADEIGGPGVDLAIGGCGKT